MQQSPEQIAAEVAEKARREQRMSFQARYPHYTPPRDADIEVWRKWWRANVELHGLTPEEAKARTGTDVTVRFPKHAQIIDLDAQYGDMHSNREGLLLMRLRIASYV